MVTIASCRLQLHCRLLGEKRVGGNSERELDGESDIDFEWESDDEEMKDKKAD